MLTFTLFYATGCQGKKAGKEQMSDHNAADSVILNKTIGPTFHTWSNYLANVQHTGYLPVEINQSPQFLWRHWISPNTNRPFSVTDGKSIFMVDNLDLRLWAYDLNTAECTYELVYDCIMSSPAIDDSVLYIGMDNRKFYAFSIPNENEIWQIRTNSVRFSVPVYDSNSVFFVGNEGKLYALNKFTGKIKWVYNISLDSALNIAYYNGKVYLVDKVLKAIDATRGNLLWSAEPRTKLQDYVSAARGLVFAKSNGYIYAFDAENGEQKWSFGTGEFVSIPIIVNDEVFILSKDKAGKKLYCLNISNGTERWTLPGDSYNKLLGASKDLLFIESDEFIHAIDFKRKKEAWKIRYLNLEKHQKRIMAQSEQQALNKGKPYISDFLLADDEILFFVKYGKEANAKTYCYAFKRNDTKLKGKYKEMYLHKSNYADYYMEGNVKELQKLFDASLQTSAKIPIGKTFYIASIDCNELEYNLNLYPETDIKKVKLHVKAYADMRPLGYEKDSAQLHIVNTTPFIDTTIVIDSLKRFVTLSLKSKYKIHNQVQSAIFHDFGFYHSNEFSFSNDPTADFYPGLVYELTFENTSPAVDSIAISEMFFCNRFITPTPPDYKTPTRIFIQDSSKLIASFPNKGDEVIYYDPGYNIHSYSWTQGSNYVLIWLVPKNTPQDQAYEKGEIRIINLKNKEDIKDLLEKTTNCYYYFGSEIISSSDGKIIIQDRECSHVVYLY